VKRSLSLWVAAWLAVGATQLGAQMMMGGGRELRGGREAMSERLASTGPGQRAWLEALRDEQAGFRTVAQRATVRAGFRSYSLDAADVSESLGLVTYSLRRPGMRLRLSGGPLRYTNGEGVAIAGVSPLDARLDLSTGARDSLRFGVRVPSSPMTLSGPQVAALAALSTATVDLASIDFGTQASVSGAYVRKQSLRGSATLSGTVGVEYEPRPSSARWSYWRGTTFRGGVTVSGAAGASRISGGVVVTGSVSDSLGGQNLFQGGGTLLARAGVTTDLGDANPAVIEVSAFYFRPLRAQRLDAANRRIPVGDFVGASALAVLPLGALLLTPTFVVSHESSHSASAATSSTGSAWAALSSLAVDVPLGSRWSVTPELGWAKGSLRSAVGDSAGGIRDSLTGWWAAAELSVSF
jgi:hypothetical protein